jgi:hypothetical protein
MSAAGRRANEYACFAQNTDHIMDARLERLQLIEMWPEIRFPWRNWSAHLGKFRW